MWRVYDNSPIGGEIMLSLDFKFQRFGNLKLESWKIKLVGLGKSKYLKNEKLGSDLLVYEVREKLACRNAHNLAWGVRRVCL